ncbi:hypothetical protein Bca101_030501 [Brassica carinata]
MENNEVLGSKGLLKKHEFVRILIQCLYSLGYKNSASCLEQESNISCKSSDFEFLEKQVLTGDWDSSLAVLDRVFDDSRDDSRRNTALYLVLKQCLSEYLRRGETSLALSVLQKQAQVFRVGREKIHMLAFDVITSKEMEPGEVDSCLVQDLRRRLLAELEKLIPTPVVIPGRRLEHLVESAVMNQIDTCMYHNSWDAVSLYEDHRCGRDQIPSETVQVLVAHKNEVWFVQFSDSGKYLATASSDCTAIIWKGTNILFQVLDDNEVELMHTLQSHQNPVSFVSWSPDDTKLLTCGNAEVLKLWDVETGVLRHTFGNNDSVFTVSSCAWFPDSTRLVCGSSDPERGIVMWDTDGNEIKAWRGTRIPKVVDLAVTPDGESMITVFSDKEIRILNLESLVERVVTEEQAITSLSVSGDGKFFIVNLSSQEIHLWDLAGEWKRSCFGGLDSSFIASGSEDSQVYIWNVKNKKPLEVLSGHSMTVNCVSWNPRNPLMLASASDDQTIRIWGPGKPIERKRQRGGKEGEEDKNGDMAETYMKRMKNRNSSEMTQPTCSMIPPRKSVASFHRRRGRSVVRMLLQREISPNAKFVSRKRWSKTRSYTMKQTGQSLLSWAEAKSLQHLSAKYCSFGLSPKSTIAAAFSSDGKTLASTHGDHTVKIIDFQTGNCLRVLTGHHRTPWVVRFHPRDSEIVASGSLDQNVRLWNATTSECIKSHDFRKPIASMAFHAEDELLAVASGHKLHMWHYNGSGEESTPVVVLKTRRSLRAVHFHPHGAPFLMTAEVSEIDPLDSSMSIATSVGHLRYPPPPAIVFTRPESSQDLPLVPTPQTVGRNRSDRPELGNIRRFIQGWFMPEGHSLEGGVSFPVQPLANWVQSEFATPLSAAATELPCTIKIKVWQHDIGDPFALMKSDTCLEMGAHFSPCGRYLAACVACVVPHAEIDPGLQTLAQQDSGLATSPTQHPLTAHQVIYELRFSPTSEHIMLAYGRHHAYLSNSIVTDGEATSHFFRVLEIYRVSDMELVRVLPSSEDEVNVACFHPSPGCGLVYGTKEGSLRIFQYNTAATSNFTGPNTYPDENLSEGSGKCSEDKKDVVKALTVATTYCEPLNLTR